MYDDFEEDEDDFDVDWTSSQENFHENFTTTILEDNQEKKVMVQCIESPMKKIS
jgi:ribosome-associated toxin RatA of RatAB toxin-antitoxin module